MRSPVVSDDVSAALDRPIWTALATRHRELALVSGAAQRFPRDISPFAASVDNSRRSVEDLGKLICRTNAEVALMQFAEVLVPPSVQLGAVADGVQMIAERTIAIPEGEGIVALTPGDVPHMLALAQATKPGPFNLRTHTLGTFFGIWHEGRLVAMAGERLKQPGFTEVSAVCVHPDYRGRGYAGVLSATVAGRVQARGETAYLHAFANNAVAIRLYERLGFRLRGKVNLAWLHPANRGYDKTQQSGVSPISTR